MKINFVVEGCENPGVVFAVRAALVAAGFNVVDCGFGVGPLAGVVDLICQPPIDFIDSVPDVLTPFAMGPVVAPTAE